MKVIGSGFGRTGTLSMKHALEELGVGPCYHMQEVMARPDHVKVWHDAGQGKAVDWQRLFDGYESAVDFPASAVYKDLMEAFPDAKVVHTVRDPDRWYESTLETIYQGRNLVPRWLRRLVPFADRFSGMVDALVWDGIFDGRFEDRDFAIARFNDWTEDVIATVPADQLLVFDVRDGWEPLCEFLGVLQPGGEFPRVNDRESMLRRFRIVRVATGAAPIVGIGVVVGLVAAIRRLRAVTPSA